MRLCVSYATLSLRGFHGIIAAGKPLPQFLIMVWSNGVVKSPHPPLEKGGNGGITPCALRPEPYAV
jgi:hypothetical protein